LLHVSATIGHLQAFKLYTLKKTAAPYCLLFSFFGAAVVFCTLSLFCYGVGTLFFCAGMCVTVLWKTLVVDFPSDVMAFVSFFRPGTTSSLVTWAK
jgi:hypothetical protein